MAALYISTKAWNQIERAVRKNRQIETGGILMGYQMNEQDWMITYASEPGPNAVQQTHSVFFDEHYLKNLISRLSKRGAGRWKYIGDWHSHTVKRLSPSKVDKHTVVEKASQAKYASNSPIMLIVGIRKGDSLQGRAYILNDSLREMQRIYLIGSQARQ